MGKLRRSVLRGRMIHNVITPHPFIRSSNKSFEKSILTRDFHSNGLKLASSGAAVPLRYIANREWYGGRAHQDASNVWKSSFEWES